jgi:hypothetical protein
MSRGRRRGSKNKATVLKQRYDHYLKAKASGIPLAVEIEVHDAFHGEKKPSRKLIEQDRARHDLQARRGRPEKLASTRWPQPVAESRPGCKVR